MQYRIEFDKRAIKFIAKQPQAQKERLFRAIYRLSDSGDIKALQARSGYFRLRVGDYRVIYTVDRNVLTVRVVEVGNRGDVYK